MELKGFSLVLMANFALKQDIPSATMLSNGAMHLDSPKSITWLVEKQEKMRGSGPGFTVFKYSSSKGHINGLSLGLFDVKQSVVWHI